MMGEIADEEIIIDKFDAYYGTSDKPANEDIIVVILVNDRLYSLQKSNVHGLNLSEFMLKYI